MPYFDHENFHVYQLALKVYRKVLLIEIPAGLGPLGDQLRRAAASMVLNTAEGIGRTGRPGKNHFRISRGSAAETSAVLDLLDPPEREEVQGDLRRIAQMLSNMMR